MELAIDTSSNIVGIALSHKGEILASLTWKTMLNHTVELLPNLVSLLRQSRVELGSIGAIIVAKGPGSFNGLRVGISTAKGLAVTLNIPLLGVNTLEAEAYPFAFTQLPVRAIHKAGRAEIATAVYRQKDDEWQCLEAANLTSVNTLCHRTKQKTLFCGEIPPDIATEIRQSLHKRAMVSQISPQFRVSSLTKLGWQNLSKGEQDDPVVLQPLYLRPPHITNPRHKIPFLSSKTHEQGQINGNAKITC